MESKASAGLPILGLLGLLFTALKLTGFIAWSWWWVLSPFLIGPALVIVVLVGWLILVAIGKAIDNWPPYKGD